MACQSFSKIYDFAPDRSGPNFDETVPNKGEFLEGTYIFEMM
jgi:hypothetical protein